MVGVEALLEFPAEAETEEPTGGPVEPEVGFESPGGWEDPEAKDDEDEGLDPPLWPEGAETDDDPLGPDNEPDATVEPPDWGYVEDGLVEAVVGFGPVGSPLDNDAEDDTLDADPDADPPGGPAD